MEPAPLVDERLDPVAGRLLVAAPTLGDPNFARTIVLLLDTDGDGVLGVVLNRPGTVEVHEVLDGWHDVVDAPAVLFQGGPVAPDNALAVGRLSCGSAGVVGWKPLFATDEGATGLIDLDAPTDVVAPALRELRVFAGYAGWSAGQLDDEIAEGAWYVVPGLPTDPFHPRPEQLWGCVLRRQPGRLAWLATYPADSSQN